MSEFFWDYRRELETNDRKCFKELLQVLDSADVCSSCRRDLCKACKGIIDIRNIMLHAEIRAFSSRYELCKKPRKSQSGNGVLINYKQIFEFINICNELSSGMSAYYVSKNDFNNWLQKNCGFEISLLKRVEELEVKIVLQDEYAIRG